MSFRQFTILHSKLRHFPDFEIFWGLNVICEMKLPKRRTLKTIIAIQSNIGDINCHFLRYLIREV